MSDKQQKPHHGLMDSLKSLVTDEVPDETPVHASTPIAAPTQTPAAPPSFNFFANSGAATGVAPAPIPATPGVPSLSSLVSAASSAPTSGPEADKFYQMLADNTDFDKTPIGQKIQAAAAPLAGIIPDPATLLRAAIASAGVTQDAILSAFDSLKVTLQQQQDSFNRHAADFEAKSITARQSRLEEIGKQIAALTAEQSQVTADLSDARSKSDSTHSGFNYAMQRRSAEIDQQKAHYAAIK